MSSLIKHEVSDAPKVRVVVAQNDKDPSSVYIGLPIDGMLAFVEGKLDASGSLSTSSKHATLSRNQAPIGDELFSTKSVVNCQKPIGMTFSEFFMDHDEVAEIYRNRRYAGASTHKQYMINKLGIFTPPSYLTQIVWKFPIVDPEDLASWHLTDDNRPWPVYVQPPPGTLYPSDFGRGTAIRWKPAKAGGRVYIVVKQPLDESSFSIEIPKYFGTMFQVPEFMICYRQYGVSNIDRSDNSITFIRRGQNPLIATINEVRSMPRGSREYQNRMQALVDVVNDYPTQLADLLNPGEVAATRAYRAAQEAASQSGSSDTSSSTDASASAGQAYRPSPNVQPAPTGSAFTPTPNLERAANYAPAANSINEMPPASNPFFQHALSLLQNSSQPIEKPITSYPMTFLAKSSSSN